VDQSTKSFPPADGVSSSRDLVLLWCLWLLGSWSVCVVDFGQAASRWMVFSCMVGLMLMWPVFRLSQSAGRPISAGSVLWDWLCLNMVLQAAIWPLHVTALWSVEQALWLAVAMAGWSMLTGLLLLICSGWASGPGRMAGTVMCLLLIVGEPVAMAALAGARISGAWSMRVSPIDTLWALTERPARVWPMQVIGVVAVAIVGWLTVGLARTVTRSAGSQGN